MYLGCAKKITEMRSIAVGGPSRLAMHLCDHLIITSGYPFWYRARKSRRTLQNKVRIKVFPEQ